MLCSAAPVGNIVNNILNNEEAFSLGRGVREKAIILMYFGIEFLHQLCPLDIVGVKILVINSLSKSMANQGNKSPFPALLKIDQAITFNFRSKDLWNMSVMSFVDT